MSKEREEARARAVVALREEFWAGQESVILGILEGQLNLRLVSADELALLDAARKAADADADFHPIYTGELKEYLRLRAGAGK